MWRVGLSCFVAMANGVSTFVPTQRYQPTLRFFEKHETVHTRVFVPYPHAIPRRTRNIARMLAFADGRDPSMRPNLVAHGPLGRIRRVFVRVKWLPDGFFVGSRRRGGVRSTARLSPSSFPLAPHQVLRRAMEVTMRLSGMPRLGTKVSQTQGRATRTTCRASHSKVEFAKYQGLGNDFILIDNRHSEVPVLDQDTAKRMCDRNFGIGGDGVIFALPPTNGADYTMRIYNSDGSEPEMCGNGIRCLARFVAQKDGDGPRSYRVHTLAGVMVPEVREDGQVCVDMGEPILEASKVPTTLVATGDDGSVIKQKLEVSGKEWNCTCVSMGNPHCVVYSSSQGMLEVGSLDLPTLGPAFESNAVFPAKTNTEFVEVVDSAYVKMRVWERGAAETLACGTGACATVVAGVLEGLVDRKCVVELPGGPLEIHWNEGDNHVYMTGPAELVFSGTVS